MDKKAALLSVSDQSGLIEFASVLQECGYTLLATSGTGKLLSANGIENVAIESYTGQKEILGGRVKTLHPKIHAGLLARRDSEEHMAQLQQDEILPIDIAVVNLYPFIKVLESDHASDPDRMIEYIDIGGPTMIRAAAKNFKGVIPVIDPEDYKELAAILKSGGQKGRAVELVPAQLRHRLATKVFTALAQYNLQIAQYLSGCDFSEQPPCAPKQDAAPAVTGIVLERAQALRYGENPHQSGAYYRTQGSKKSSWQQRQGKELSYNNLLDFDAAFKLIRAFKDEKPTVAILKHLNPCGAARGDSLFDALQRAKKGDPRSHFGGILAFNLEVDAATAHGVAEDFAEIVVAPSYSVEALEIFSKKKNLRVIEVDFSQADQTELRSVQSGYLLQQIDSGVCEVTGREVVSARRPSEEELRDLQFAWILCAHIKSNAICIVRDEMLLSCGAGQMSRIDSVEVALHKAEVHQHDLHGAVAASDAFFPFPDCLQAMAEAGVRAVIAPSGAKRDAEIIETAKTLDVALLFVGERHFRH